MCLQVLSNLSWALKEGLEPARPWNTFQALDSPLKVILGAGEIRGVAERKPDLFRVSSFTSSLGVAWPCGVMRGAGLPSLPDFESPDLVDTKMLGVNRGGDGFSSCLT